MFALAFALLAVVPGLEVTIAPDHPVAQAYAGEPLIIEFRAERAMSLSGRIAFESDGIEVESHPFGALPLPASKPYWLTLPGAGEKLGAYEISIYHGETLLTSERFCRVERPTEEVRDGIILHWDDFSADGARVVSALRRTQVHLNGMTDGFGNSLLRANRLGLEVTVRVDSHPDSGSASPLAIAKESPVAQWEFDAHGSAPGLIAWTQALRDARPAASVKAVVHSADEVTSLLSGEAGLWIDGFVVDAPEGNTVDVSWYRSAAESLGFEGFTFDVAYLWSDLGMPLGVLAAHSKDFGYDRVFIRGENASDARGPRTLYAELSGSGHWLNQTAYIGPFMAATGQRGYAFRSRDHQSARGAWIAYFGPEAAHVPLALGLGAASDIELSDAFGNSYPEGTWNRGVLLTDSPGTPLVVRGREGSMEATAAWQRVVNEVDAFLTDERLLDFPIPELMETAGELLSNKGESSARFTFFTFVRALPTVEEQWKTGEISPGAGAAMVGALARLARALATHEHAQGEPFLEPLRETLARCAEFQSLYVTGKGSGSRENVRAEWLLREIQRLTNEARDLEAQGRRIEANGVAVLAEWRARSLLVAAQPDGSRRSISQSP